LIYTEQILKKGKEKKKRELVRLAVIVKGA
jgi:hypothetical protein